MKGVVRYERLSREVRLQVVAMLDFGKDPAVVAKELRIPLPAVYGAQAWSRHVRAHQHATKSLREQLAQLAPVETPQPAVATTLECTVVRSLSGPCSSCRAYTDGLHVVDGQEGPPRTFCSACCVVCNAPNRTAEVVP